MAVTVILLTNPRAILLLTHKPATTGPNCNTREEMYRWRPVNQEVLYISALHHSLFPDLNVNLFFVRFCLPPQNNYKNHLLLWTKLLKNRAKQSKTEQSLQPIPSSSSSLHFSLNFYNWSYLSDLAEGQVMTKNVAVPEMTQNSSKPMQYPPPRSGNAGASYPIHKRFLARLEVCNHGVTPNAWTDSMKISSPTQAVSVSTLVDEAYIAWTVSFQFIVFLSFGNMIFVF